MNWHRPVFRPRHPPSPPPQTRKAQKEVDFLKEVGEATGSLRELRAAHAETIQELQKTRNILNMESNICKDLQVDTAAPPQDVLLTSLPVDSLLHW